ncbi:hypothetical protein BDFG_06377 [Blastomyces dermatitidis ATCC 26199]|nr:hypothetical protein BDFG_06377 [Blastomyces dermatitidis ATCC 26199]
MTVSIEPDGFLVLLIAIILFHQASEGLGLGSWITQVPYPKKSLRPWDFDDCLGRSSGLLIHAATVDLLVEDFLWPEGFSMSKTQKLSCSFSWGV